MGFAFGGGLGFGDSAGDVKLVSFFHARPTSLAGQKTASVGLCLWAIRPWF